MLVLKHYFFDQQRKLVAICFPQVHHKFGIFGIITVLVQLKFCSGKIYGSDNRMETFLPKT